MPQLNTVRVWKCGCVIDPLNGILVYCAQTGCSRSSEPKHLGDSGKNVQAWVEPARLIRLFEKKE